MIPRWLRDSDREPSFYCLGCGVEIPGSTPVDELCDECRDARAQREALRPEEDTRR